MYKLQENFADNLNKELRSRKITRTAFGRMCGQSVQTVSNYCNKLSAASIKRAEEWSEILGRDAFEMLASKEDAEALRLGKKCLDNEDLKRIVMSYKDLTPEQVQRLLDTLEGDI